MTILSLSTIPPRFKGLAPVLDSLLHQSTRLSEIRLYLPKKYRRFPDYDGTPPAFASGVTVIEVPEDLGPATKILYAVEAIAGDDSPILFCDDDRVYHRDWAAMMIAAAQSRPKDCISAHGHPLRHIDPTQHYVPARPQARFRTRFWAAG